MTSACKVCPVHIRGGKRATSTLRPSDREVEARNSTSYVASAPRTLNAHLSLLNSPLWSLQKPGGLWGLWRRRAGHFSCFREGEGDPLPAKARTSKEVGLGGPASFRDLGELLPRDLGFLGGPPKSAQLP